jgi:hypothetical protein
MKAGEETDPDPDHAPDPRDLILEAGETEITPQIGGGGTTARMGISRRRGHNQMMFVTIAGKLGIGPMNAEIPQKTRENILKTEIDLKEIIETLDAINVEKKDTFKGTAKIKAGPDQDPGPDPGQDLSPDPGPPHRSQEAGQEMGIRKERDLNHPAEKESHHRNLLRKKRKMINK